MKNLHVVAHVGQEEGSQERDITLLYKVQPGTPSSQPIIIVAFMLTWDVRLLGPEFRYPRRSVSQLPRKCRQGKFAFSPECSYAPPYARMQLAKRKADELEDFAVGQHPEPQHSDEVTEEGIQIVEELLRTWAESTSAAGTDGEDVVMEDASESVDAQLEELRRCVDAFRPRIEGNAWVQSIIAAL